MIRAAIFDWNGTVMNDSEVMFETCNHMLEYHGAQRISRTRFEETFTLPWTLFYERNGVNLDAIDIPDHQNEYLRKFRETELVRNPKPYENLEKVLEWLKERKLEIAILSGHHESDIKERIKKFKLERFIDFAIGEETAEEMGKASKHMDALFKTLSARPNECIYIGDLGADIRIGRLAGMKTIAMVSGYQSESVLKSEKPDFLIRNVSEIVGIVKKLNA
ncbi:MAG: HAD hydrolase-like protein [Candidatus Aenigmatarchaeota archaeon]